MGESTLPHGPAGSMKVCTLCFIVADDRMLLGLKRTGFGVGKYNGFGGKVEASDASIDDAACRELREEAGLSVASSALEKVAEISFYFPNAPAGKLWDHYVHVYLARTFSGSPVSSDEMLPQWFALDAIPYDKMWKADATFLPLLLEGKRVRATYFFADDCENIARHEIHCVDRL